MEADAVVIGAGIHGCAVALRLAQAGRRVVVLERSIPGAEASSAAAGILSPAVEAAPGPFLDLCLLSRALAIAAAGAGARFITGLVRGIALENGRAAGVEHESGRIAAEAVVVAAGSWSGLLEGSGLPAGAVRPVRGQMAVVET